jgi:hypothetical protein
MAGVRYAKPSVQRGVTGPLHTDRAMGAILNKRTRRVPYCRKVYVGMPTLQTSIGVWMLLIYVTGAAGVLCVG